ncbi:hypothetical protein C1H46_030616 [Malus baccata]|uniref:Uncharacterized protein n=1 Tax=Malus baccata TaxID=106549 RepID=A0A540LBL2_MALBA|nr:hypothetical protein C1H46_030616 [Malus baccata]
MTVNTCLGQMICYQARLLATNDRSNGPNPTKPPHTPPSVAVVGDGPTMSALKVLQSAHCL